jgi:hypothetical protein
VDSGGRAEADISNAAAVSAVYMDTVVAMFDILTVARIVILTTSSTSTTVVAIVAVDAVVVAVVVVVVVVGRVTCEIAWNRVIGGDSAPCVKAA